MASIPQRSQVTFLTHLPHEPLGNVVDICADDAVVGRATLRSLSVVSRYLRDVTKPRLFQWICFRDGPQSPGDEILHSIRRLLAAPEIWHHARVLSLYLNRLYCLGADHASLKEPYHPLVLPELVEALVKMPKITDIYIHTEGKQGKMCLKGLGAAVRWCTAGRGLNIRSLTLSPESKAGLDCDDEGPQDDEVDILGALPQLKALCYEGTSRYSAQLTLDAARFSSHHPTIASNLTQLRMYQTCSYLGAGRDQDGWRAPEIRCLNLSETTPELEYLSILGELRNIPVENLLKDLAEIPKLKYLDITDEQLATFRDSMRDFEYGMQPRTLDTQRSARDAYIEYQAYITETGPSRWFLAHETFKECPQLRRICFVRCLVGEVYLRDYADAVANSTGYISPEVKNADLCEIPRKWRHGVPQMGPLPFPSFTPWEDRF